MSQKPSKNIAYVTYDEKGLPTWQSGLTEEENTDRSHCILQPDHVVPVVFIPGIMGSNLKRTDRKDVAWQPDNNVFNIFFNFKSAAGRRKLLNPDYTEVDYGGEVPDDDSLFFGPYLAT